MSDMEETTEQFARDLAIASGDLPDTPAGPAPGVPTWRLDYLPVAQALTQAGYGRVDVAPTPDEPTQPVPDELVEAVGDVLSLRTQPSETPTDAFERLADAFLRDTGFMRPGKSVPCEMEEIMTEEERRTAWNEWCLAKYERLTAALSLPRKTEAEIRADELVELMRAFDARTVAPDRLDELSVLVKSILMCPTTKTVEEVRADERDRLLCLALGSEEDDYYARDGYVAEWLRSQTQVEE